MNNVYIKDINEIKPGDKCWCEKPAMTQIEWEQGNKTFTVKYCEKHVREVIPPIKT